MRQKTCAICGGKLRGHSNLRISNTTDSAMIHKKCLRKIDIRALPFEIENPKWSVKVHEHNKKGKHYVIIRMDHDYNKITTVINTTDWDARVVVRALFEAGGDVVVKTSPKDTFDLEIAYALAAKRMFKNNTILSRMSANAILGIPNWLIIPLNRFIYNNFHEE